MKELKEIASTLMGRLAVSGIAQQFGYMGAQWQFHVQQLDALDNPEVSDIVDYSHYLQFWGMVSNGDITPDVASAVEDVFDNVLGKGKRSAAPTGDGTDWFPIYTDGRYMLIVIGSPVCEESHLQGV